MKKLTFIVFAFLSAAIFSCQSSSSDDTTSGELTSDQVSAISAVLVGAMNDSGSSGAYSSSVGIDSFSWADTCNGSDYAFTAAGSGTYSCPTSGHITYSGNMNTYCSAWQYYTSPSVYCNCTGNWYTQNSFTFQVSDPTNNLYDCETGGIVVDGTVYIDVTGPITAMNIGITGTLGVNERGPTGGLVPIMDDCSIFMYYNGTTQAWTGTICGYSVSSLEANSIPVANF